MQVATRDPTREKERAGVYISVQRRAEGAHGYHRVQEGAIVSRRVEEDTGGCGRAQARQMPHRWPAKYQTPAWVGPDVYKGVRARWIQDQTSGGVRHPCVAGQAFPGTGNVSGSITESWTPRIRARASSSSNRRICGADVLRDRRWAGAALVVEVRCRSGYGSSKQS